MVRRGFPGMNDQQQPVTAQPSLVEHCRKHASRIAKTGGVALVFVRIDGLPPIDIAADCVGCDIDEDHRLAGAASKAIDMALAARDRGDGNVRVVIGELSGGRGQRDPLEQQEARKCYTIVTHVADAKVWAAVVVETGHPSMKSMNRTLRRAFKS